MISVEIRINGDNKIILKGPEPRDLTALQLALGDAKTLKVTKVGDEFVLTREEKSDV